MERRQDPRYAKWLPLRINSTVEGLAVSHNASRSGMLLVTSVELEPGSLVRLSFPRTPGSAPDCEVEGNVVRSGTNLEDPDGLWPYSAAIEFSAPSAELEKLLEQLGAEAG